MTLNQFLQNRNKNYSFTIGFPMNVILTVDTGLLFFSGFIWPNMLVAAPRSDPPASLSTLCLLLPVLLLMLFLRLSAGGPSIIVISDLRCY